MASDVRWIKIVTDVFDDEKILMIETLPECDTIIVIWFKLLCLAGKQNNSGVFQMGHIPYTDEMFATIFRRNLNTVRLALRTFEQFGMVEIINDTVTIPNWGKHQSIDQIEAKNAYMKKYMREYREKQKLISSGKTNCKTNSKTNVSEADKIREEEEKEVDKEKREKTDFQSVVDLFHTICVSYPKVRSLSEARKKAIGARLKTYSMDEIRTVFENAENSSFLKGKNDRNWSANFDWLIADKNMVKVLEGAYADKGRRYGKKEYIPDWMESGQRGLDEDEIAAIKKMMEEDDDDFQAEAEQLRKELQESFGRSG